ncbi:MAG: acetylxylan esterase [Chloroflexi bacterium]|nr:acetylxylan esterase [Chloroflexota bacterium]
MSHWDMTALRQPPCVHAAPGFETAGVRALFYESVSWQGRPTRVFAWYGAPPHAEGEKLPALVLVHGGGGTAFADWVRLWNSRGYAAIAMDTCGGVPCWTETPYYALQWPRHAHAGPNGWGNFDQSHLPVEAQWMYHAIAAIVLGHSLLRSFDEIDPQRIGMTGISWGGILTCIAAGIDARFQFAVPVYGSGFLGGASSAIAESRAEHPQAYDRWLTLWDPAHYLPQAAMPMLWVNGTNDFAFLLDSFQQSYRLPRGERTLCVRVRMPHAHGGPGEKPEEIRVFADALTRGSAALPHVTGQGRAGDCVWASYTSARPIVRAEVNFTRALGHWTDRTWNTLPAALDVVAGQVSAHLLAGTSVYYFNLFDQDECVVSTEHVEL